MALQLDPRPWSGVAPAVGRDGAYQPVSYWQETVSVTPSAPLRERIACDVAIVGAGFTGLSTARELKRLRPELDIVVLEKEVAGHGASGRNGGFAMPLLGWDPWHTAKAVGEAAMVQAYRLTYDAVTHLKAIVAEDGIDCDLEATGYLLINTSDAWEREVRAGGAQLERLGFDVRWLDRAAMTEYIDGPHFRSALFDPAPCVVNPAKLARGLKAAAERLGVRVYEQTPALRIDDGAPAVIATPEGEVRATQAVLGLNGYGAAMGFMPAQILPVHTYIVLTEPLTQAQLESVGWARRRASLETARNFIHYFRLTADHRIAFGGEDADLYLWGKYRNHDAAIFAALERRFREYFPPLRAVRFTHAWGGTLGVTLDMFPTVGRGGPHGNLFHAAGYSGHGVSLANYAGRMLAPEMLRAAGHRDVPPGPERPFFWDRRPIRLPPDPLRYAGMQAYRLVLKAHDAWRGA